VWGDERGVGFDNLLEFGFEVNILCAAIWPRLSGLHAISLLEEKDMARLKRSSTVLEAARQRLAGLKSINPTPDFGSNLKLDEYEQEINALSDALGHYNEMVSTLDQLKNRLEADEERLKEKNKRMLAAASAFYGPNSSEYEQAGGTRTSERKRPTRKTVSKG
jgi:hypothetical protein